MPRSALLDSRGRPMRDHDRRVRDAVRAIEPRLDGRAGTAIILGSGLGELVSALARPVTVPFESIPHFARSTADGHRGALIAGRLAGQPVIALAGRLHRYEGWSERQIRFPVRVLAALGASTLVVSNAAGGLNPSMRVGDIVAISDHIDLMWGQPSMRLADADRRAAPEVLGRHGCPYDPQLRQLAERAGRDGGFAVHRGTYLATLGPNYETRSEYRFMRRIGADVVGMSTVPEVREAICQRMRVLALSVISNAARPDVAARAEHEEVLDVGRAAEPKLRRIVTAVLGASPHQAATGCTGRRNAGSG